MSDLRDWMAGRSPLSSDVLPVVIPDGPGDPVGRLADAGIRALERALTGQGERRGAYELLTADALLTYACEAAAVTADPEAELLGLLERVRQAG